MTVSLILNPSSTGTTAAGDDGEPRTPASIRHVQRNQHREITIGWRGMPLRRSHITCCARASAVRASCSAVRGGQQEGNFFRMNHVDDRHRHLIFFTRSCLSDTKVHSAHVLAAPVLPRKPLHSACRILCLRYPFLELHSAFTRNFWKPRTNLTSP